MEDTTLYEIRPRLVYGTEKEAKTAYDYQLKAIKSALKAKTYKTYLTGKGNYREAVATIQKYKGNREFTEKPYWFYNTREYAISLGAIVIDGNEADDACSVVTYRGYLEKPKNPTTVCVSVDKDLRNTPGYHYNQDKDEAAVFIDMDTANLNFYRQLLKGDKSTDNIPGCQGLSKNIATKYGSRKIATIGDKGAESLLVDCVTEVELYERCYEVYLAWYSEQDGWDVETNTYQYTSWDNKQYERTIDEIMKEQADLLWMQRIKGDRWEIPID
jgi:5'-3' exonuclease